MDSDPSLRTIFNAALEQDDPAERLRYLEGACGEDTVLREKVIELLDAYDEAGGFFSNPSMNPSASAGLHALAEPVTEKTGDTIGRYKLLQQIGEGGCGVVYMAEQEEPVRRRVALKVIKLGMDTKSVIARFEAERQALALMDHPNIARVLDAGATDTGRPYFVMELVRGIKITEYCDQNNLPTGQRLALFNQVCSAVQHAHQKGIIHRDLKPSNILVTLHDGVPVPKVIDFGIAKATTGQRLTDKTLFTAFEQFIGTPAYMSPEQAEMSGLDIDTRSDIYALGVLLYELLTGQTPFDAKELLAAGLDAMRRTIRETEPQKPSTRLTQLLTQGVPASASARPPQSGTPIASDLDWIVMKALEKDRTRRYDSASGLASDIQRHLNNEPVTARPPTNLYRFQKLIRRNKRAVVAASAVAAALVIGIAASIWQAVRATTAEHEQGRLRTEAEANAKTAQTEGGKSRQIAQFLQDMLQSVGPSVALGRDTKLLREILDKTAERLGEDLSNQPEVEAELRYTLGRVYSELGDYEKAAAMLRRALEVQRKLFGNEHGDVAASLNDLANVLQRQGKLDEAEPMHREVLRLYRELLGNEHTEVANALTNMGIALRTQGKFDEAESMQREALAMQRKLSGNDHPDVATALNNLAVVLDHLKRPAEAETLHREALAMRRKLVGKDDPQVALSLTNLANVLLHQNKLDEAETLQREAVAMQRKLVGDTHPMLALSLTNLAGVLRKQGKLPEAETVYREALTMQRALSGDKHPDAVGTLSSLANVLREQAKLDEAETADREALALLKERLGSGHRDVAAAAFSLALKLHEQGKSAEAEPLLREALESNRKLLPPEYSLVARQLGTLGRILEAQHKFADAETQFRDAYERSRKLPGNERAAVVPWQSSLAVILEKQGKLPELESMQREALEAARNAATPDPEHLETRFQNLAATLASQGKFGEAEPLFRDALQRKQPRLGAEHNHVIGVMAALARMLADWSWAERGSPKPEAVERAREAESLMRECLATWLRGPEANALHWTTSEFRSRLGGAIEVVAAIDPALTSEARLAKFAEAESLLLGSNEAFQRNQKAYSKLKRDALIRLVRLYEAWNKADKAAQWQQKLIEFDTVDAKRQNGH